MSNEATRKMINETLGNKITCVLTREKFEAKIKLIRQIANLSLDNTLIGPNSMNKVREFAITLAEESEMETGKLCAVMFNKMDATSSAMKKFVDEVDNLMNERPLNDEGLYASIWITLELEIKKEAEEFVEDMKYLLKKVDELFKK